MLGTSSHAVVIPGTTGTSLAVAGNTTVGGTLGVTGTTTFTGNVVINGRLTLNNVGSSNVSGSYLRFSSGSNGQVGYSSSSDKRLKNISGESKDGLEKIRQLKTFNFTFKKDKKKTPMVGVMAQDLQKVFPHAVIKGDDGYLMIRQEDMFYAMINSIKQLDKMVQGVIGDFKAIAIRVQKVEEKLVAMAKFDTASDKRIKELEQKNKMLEQRLKKLEKLVSRK